MSKRSVKRYLQDILTAIEKIMPYLSKSSNKGGVFSLSEKLSFSPETTSKMHLPSEISTTG